MKNCPMCGQEYYDEAKWCPDCAYDFPPGGAADPASVEREGRIRKLLEAAGGDPEKLWKFSTQFLSNAAEYEIARSRLAVNEER